MTEKSNDGDSRGTVAPGSAKQGRAPDPAILALARALAGQAAREDHERDTSAATELRP